MRMMTFVDGNNSVVMVQSEVEVVLNQRRSQISVVRAATAQDEVAGAARYM